MTNENSIDPQPRYSFSKAKAKEIWVKFLQEKIPVIINDIVKNLDIKVIKCNLEVSGLARMDSSGNCLIFYNENMSDTRKRFTVAHELGHIILEHISYNGDSSQLQGRLQEIEADTFAGNLLIPITDLRKFLKDKNRTIKNLTSRYWVSKDAVIVALKSNKLLNKVQE